MPVRVIFFGNSASAFTRRHLTALLNTSVNLIALVDIPPAQRETTNPTKKVFPDFATTTQNLQVQNFEPSSPNSEQFVNALRALKPDLFIAVGYPLILKSQSLNVPCTMAVNFHASLLPDYRGKHPVFWTLRHGERWAGLTVHAMDSGIDTGDILYQVKLRTRRDDSVASLYSRIMDQSVELIGQLVADAERGSIRRIPQQLGTGSYHSSITAEDYHLRWDWSAEKIRRYITITPGKCFLDICEHPVYFHNAEIERTPSPAPPGTLLRLGRKQAVVAASQGALSSSIVQVSGREVETFAGFCRRMDLNPGDKVLV